MIHWQQDGNKIYLGNVLDVLKSMPTESAQMCATSPPYWGLRDYGNEPQIWKPADNSYKFEFCSHVWGDELPGDSRGGSGTPTDKNNRGENYGRDATKGQFCQICGAWRGSLGLEPTPELFISHMVEIFSEVRRVLRSDGTLWLNMGDSYTANGRSGLSIKGESSTLMGTANIAHTAQKKTVPSGLKPKDLIGIPWRLALALQADGWYLRSAMPWVKRCLSGGVIVYAQTQKGVMPTNLKDLYRLVPETVKLWNGDHWTQLKGMTKQARKGNEIELFLRSGERISCTPEHRWPTESGLKYAIDLEIGDIIKSCRIPGTMWEPECLPDDLIGWFVGIYLAEGSRDSTGTIQISSHIKETVRFEQLCSIANKYHGTCHMSQTSDNGMTIRLYSKILNSFIDNYIAGRVAKDKHLSNNCWSRSNDFLKSLLMGYLEGDGSYEKKNDRWRLGFCNNDMLVADLRCLCARLGVSIRLKRTVHKCQSGKFKGYRGQLRFNLSDKSINSTNYKKLSDNEIVKIGKPRARYYYDIEVEDEPHLFSLASGILTHNSAMPESCKDRPASALEYMFLLSKNQRYYFDMESIKIKASPDSHRRYARGRSDNHKWADGGPGNQTIAKSMDHMIKVPGVTPKSAPAGSGIKANDSFQAACVDLVGSRNFRNTDLFYQSIEPPHGAIFCGDELVGLDVNPQAQKAAHFATFAEKLIEPCILAGTSEKGCCAECGAPWERVTETEYGNDKSSTNHIAGGDKSIGQGWEGTQRRADVKSKTTGWQSTCKCKADTKPCTVMDIFGGSMTTAIVAHKHGRRFKMIELSQEYIDEIGIPRIEKATKQFGWRRFK